MIDVGTLLMFDRMCGHHYQAVDKLIAYMYEEASVLLVKLINSICNSSLTMRDLRLHYEGHQVLIRIAEVAQMVCDFGWLTYVMRTNMVP